MSPLAPALVAAVVAVPLVFTTGPAAAATEEEAPSRVVLPDPTGDVWMIGEGEDEEWTSAGDMPTADVTRAVVRHGRFKLVVRMTFSNLRRVDPQSYDAMHMSRSGYGAMFVWTGPGRWGGRHMLVDEEFGKVKCPGLDHDIDYAEDRILMTVPRKCIDRPDWVKVGLSNTMFLGETEEEFRQVTDNPHTTEPEGRMTARLYRDQG